MAYTPDLASSARRHLRAAQELVDGKKRIDVAGYLFGIAAECAIKAMMIESGMRPGDSRRDDPFYAHFPQLRTMLRDSLSGRKASQISRFVFDDKFMSAWDTDMRYSHGRDIKEAWVVAWKKQAEDAVSTIGT